MSSEVTMTQYGHSISMRWAAGIDGQYCWHGMCDCAQFTAQAPTWAMCANLCEEHLAEMMLNG